MSLIVIKKTKIGATSARSGLGSYVLLLPPLLPSHLELVRPIPITK